MNFLYYLVPYLQQFQLQILVYLIPIFISLKGFLKIKILNKRDFKNFFIFPVLLILFAFINLFSKGFGFNASVVAVQYFLGVFLILFFLKGKIINLIGFIRGFYSCCLIEYAYFLIFKDYPFYIKNYFANSEVKNILTRSTLDNELHRLLGPALNSTVTSSILAVIIVSILINKIFPPSSNMFFHNLVKIKTFDVISITLSFILASSVTGYLTLIFGVLLSLFIKILTFRISWKISKKSFFSFALFSSVFFLIIRNKNVNDIFLGFLNTKFNFIYISEVLNFKYFEQLRIFDNAKEIIFGLNYSDQLFTGGDFLILSFIENLGIIIFLLFLIALYRQAKNINNRLLITMILFSSLHYGTAFNIIGQFFLALILAGSFRYRNISKTKKTQCL